MVKIHTRLTVGQIRKAIESLPDSAEVLVDFQTEYDGMDVEKQGTATWCVETARDKKPALMIDATEEFR